MKVLVVAGDVLLLRALLSAFRAKGVMSYGCTRGDWCLHAAKIHSAAPFDAVVVGGEFPSGSKRRPMETNAEFVARLSERDPLFPCACLVPDESAPVPFGVTRVVIIAHAVGKIIREGD